MPFTLMSTYTHKLLSKFMLYNKMRMLFIVVSNWGTIFIFCNWNVFFSLLTMSASFAMIAEVS